MSQRFKKLTPNKLGLRDLKEFTPNKLRLRDLNYRFPDTFISHIGKIKVVRELIRGVLDWISNQFRIFKIFWMYYHSYRSKLDDNLIKRNVETQFTNDE